MSDCPRAAFAATVRSYVGTPYVDQARVPGPNGGMDCPGPIILAAREHGLVLPTFDVTGYRRVADGHSLQAFCELHMRRITSDDMREGDVVLARFQNGLPHHLGVLVEITPDGRRYWVHAESYRYKAVIYSRLMFGPRLMQFVAAYRVPGVV